MQHSRSLRSFSSGSTTLAPGQQPRARSSLDTFVIPGRTRIPSSKAELIDLQIAEKLLNSVITRSTREPLDVMSASQGEKHPESQHLLNPLDIKDSQSPEASRHQCPSSRERRNRTSSSSRENSVLLHTLHSRSQKVHKVRPEISKRPPPQIGGPDVLVIPPRRPRKIAGDSSPKRLRPTPPRKATPPLQQPRDGYDGAIGSSYESRTTSMTWSTISHRILTDSSGSFQGLQASESLNEFNRLAIKHGIPEMEKHSDDEYTKVTEKSHHHNWLARKLFHRTSSTYTLKVKSNQRRLKHKKSFRMIARLEDPDHKNILKDKSLEEVCRLGGMGLLVLPEGFSVNKQLPLPNCLSAAATYLLQHGTNHPGLFRVSGQSSTINALYEYYAFQFAQAGSPSKVQETVGASNLPTHIEYSVPDVASLFKKILNALPGGLLGSLELFEAFRNIFFRLNPGLELSETDTRMLQAKLIALAISSVTSTKRASLIQAVLGLVAYFGNEAEESRKNSATNMDESGDASNSSSELMGYQALGVVMGPLMLGNLIDQLDPILSPENEDMARKSFDSVKKADKKADKKQRRSVAGNKLDRDTTLSVHVDRANLSANITELLLMVWTDVIVQLRELLPGTSLTSIHDAGRQLRGSRNGAGSRQHSRNSEEELFFIDMIKRRPPPLRAGYSQEFKMKRKVKVGRSPRVREGRQASPDSFESLTVLTSSGKPLVSGANNPPPDGAGAIIGTGKVVREIDSSAAGSHTSNSPEVANSIREDQRSKSELAMAQMSMGTILPRLQDSPITPIHKEMLRSVSRPQTPMMKSHKSKANRSSSGAPEMAVRDLPKPSGDSHQLIERRQSSLGNALPPTDDSTCTFPPRKDSLPAKTCTKRPPDIESFEPTLPIPTFNGALQSRRRSSTASGSQKANPAGSSQAVNGPSNLFKSSRLGSVRVLAQHFDDTPTSGAQAGSMDSKNTIVYAEIRELPNPSDYLRDDPFSSFSEASLDRSPGKASRIPKPARDVGNTRNDHSDSSSPSKSPKVKSSMPGQLPPNGFPTKRPSSFQLTEDTGAALVNDKSTEPSQKTEPMMHSATPDRERNAVVEEKPDRVDLRAGETQQDHNESSQTTIPMPFRDPPPQPRRVFSKSSQRGTNSSVYLEVAPTRPLSAYSVESLRRMHLADEPPVAQYIPPRNIPTNGNVDETWKDAETSAELRSDSLRHSGSIHTAMAVEIHHLKYLLEQREKDIRETRRSLDAIRDSREEGMINGNDGARRSISKGTLANELRTARKETAEWKRRAQWAEGRLAVVGQPSKGETGQSVEKYESGRSGEEKPQFWLHE